MLLVLYCPHVASYSCKFGNERRAAVVARKNLVIKQALLDILVGKFKGKRPLEDLGVDGKV
jgi:hypothetical protein